MARAKGTSTKAAENGQLDFETRDLPDAKLEAAIAKEIVRKARHQTAHKEYQQASSELKKLLPLDSVEQPTRIKVASKDGNWVVEITPRDRPERKSVPAGVSKYVKVVAV